MNSLNALKRGAAGALVLLATQACIDKSGTDNKLVPTPGPVVEPRVVGQFAATDWQLVYPTRLAMVGDTLFVSDPKANKVMGYNQGVADTTLAGLDQPLGVAVYGDLLYVGNAGRKDVEVYSITEKKYLRSLGGVGAFELPNSIAVAPNGLVYVADSKRDVVKVFDANGNLVNTIGGTGTVEGQFRFPNSVAVNANLLAVADRDNHRVQLFNTNGSFVRSFGSIATGGLSAADFRGKFTSIGAVEFDRNELLVLDSANASVQVFNLDGVYRGTFGYAGDCANCSRMPLDIAVDAQGGVLATDPENRRLIAVATEMR